MLLKRGTCVLDVNTFLGTRFAHEHEKEFLLPSGGSFFYSVELVCNIGCTTAYVKSRIDMIDRACDALVLVVVDSDSRGVNITIHDTIQ